MVKVFSHIAMSALLLVTATGMTINVHYCQGHLYDMALNAPAHSCCEPDAKAKSCHHDQAQPVKHHCEDETVTLESTGDYVIPADISHFENNHSNDLFFITLLLDETPGEADVPSRYHLKDKRPPPSQVVELSQLQCFLI
jgi:hypothetical protein